MGGGGQRRQGEGAQRATADQRVRSGSGGKGAPTKARAGPPGKRARDPTATSTRAVPRRPGTPASLSTLGAPPPPREPGPTPLGPAHPHGTPAAGARFKPPPVCLVHPGTTTRGEAPPGESGPDPCPDVTAGGHSTGAGSRRSRSHGNRAGDARPRGSGHARTHSHATREPHVPDASQARRDPPPTRRGEAQAAVGKRATLGPTAGPADPSQRGGSAQHATVVTPHRWPLRAEEGRQLGGSGTPKAPSRIAREGFLTEGASPPPIRPPDRAPRNGVPKASKGLGAGVGLRPCSHHRPEGTSCLHRGHERSGDGHSMLGKNSSSPRVAKRHSAGPARH
ncbi:nascent polypeptide-associated complex subunit alpha, muscle-specific form-like, partial [Neovison vison]|uniref:nascent polypeptide-associated complex subunit alpha, muscle-specific form-like n=1 Tax=Neovison vison TaxID=452646 RepID=UPI001CEFE3FC